MLPLTKEQRVKVEENMGLVGKVIGDCVHTLDKPDRIALENRGPKS